MTDIAVTWPKGRTLASYYAELERARASDQLINYRVTHPPRERPERCYMVHDGAVRCWSQVIDVKWFADGRIVDPTTGAGWRAGYYVVRDPAYVELTEPVAMRGFQGFRYVDRETLS